MKIDLDHRPFAGLINNIFGLGVSFILLVWYGLYVAIGLSPLIIVGLLLYKILF